MTSLYIHPLAEVLSNTIGNRTRVWQFCVILNGAKIGEDCNINSHCFIENYVLIGDRVTIKSGVQIWDSIRIDNDVFIGPNVTFCNDKYPRSRHPPLNYIPTIIRRGVSIGANATILCGVEIGENAMIGAGSVVTKNIPAGELWVGNPAKPKIRKFIQL